MLAATASHADWIGIHYYPVYGGGIVQYPWPGGLVELVEMAEQYHDDVRVTEFNLREPDEICSAVFEQAQADEIQAALDLGLPMLSVLVYYPAQIGNVLEYRVHLQNKRSCQDALEITNALP